MNRKIVSLNEIEQEIICTLIEQRLMRYSSNEIAIMNLTELLQKIRGLPKWKQNIIR